MTDVSALYREAVALHEQALPIHRELGDRLGEARALAGYGAAFKKHTGSQSADALIEDAIRLFERLGLPDEAEHARGLMEG